MRTRFRNQLTRAVIEALDYPVVKRDCPARKIVNVIISVITSALQRGESVRIQNFGSFRVWTRKSYMTRSINFRTGESLPVKINPYTYVTFLPSRGLKKELNYGPQSQL